MSRDLLSRISCLSQGWPTMQLFPVHWHFSPCCPCEPAVWTLHSVNNSQQACKVVGPIDISTLVHGWCVTFMQANTQSWILYFCFLFVDPQPRIFGQYPIGVSVPCEMTQSPNSCCEIPWHSEQKHSLRVYSSHLLLHWIDASNSCNAMCSRSRLIQSLHLHRTCLVDWCTWVDWEEPVNQRVLFESFDMCTCISNTGPFAKHFDRGPTMYCLQGCITNKSCL